LKQFLLVLFSVVVLIVAFLAFTHVSPFYGAYRHVRAFGTFLVGPTTKAFHSFFALFGDLFDRYVLLLHLKEENMELRKKVERMELELQRLHSIENENRRLRELLEFKERSPFVLLPARVTGEDVKSLFRSILIDRGNRHGVREKMVVISPKGLVGISIEASYWHTKVLTLNDFHFSVDGVIEEKNIRGIVEGLGSANLKMKYVLKKQDVQVGDRVVTSGRDGLYPRGIPIGVVVAISPSTSEIFLDIDLAPYVDLSTLSEVFVVTKW
jgi:rod shape-determining protein MreC